MATQIVISYLDYIHVDENFIISWVDKGNAMPANAGLNTMKRETMFIQLLEGLTEGEARVLIDIKD